MIMRPGGARATSPNDWRQMFASPLVQAALAWMAGSIAAHAIGGGAVNTFLLAGGASLALAGVMLRRQRPQGVRIGLLLAVFFLSGAWLAARSQSVAPDSILPYARAEPQLARVRGTVQTPVKVAPAQRGEMARYNYETPVTFTSLAVDALMVDGRWRPASGLLLVKIMQTDDRLRLHDRVEMVGWLAGFEPPGNPGEFDYQQLMHRRGVDGRLTLRRRGNWRLIEHGTTSSFAALRHKLSDAAANALRLGMENDPQALSLCNLLLLGRDTGDAELHDHFRDVGLAHILAISGAHLAILLGLVWLLARLVIARPSLATLVVLIVLGLYLLVVPWKTPIIRAAIMAGVFCLAGISGRRIKGHGVDLLALAALLVLLWRPADLFTAGFQLSFGVVLALLLFADRLEQIVWPRHDAMGIAPLHEPWQLTALRYVWGYTAMSLVAAAAALPLAAYHFQMVTPFAVVLSVLALPVVTLVLALGYVKILAGLAWPSVSLLLSGLLAWSAKTLIGLVDQARTWPGATVRLSDPPSLAWTVAMLAVLFAWGAGALKGRRIAATLAVLLMLAWTFWVGAGSSVERAPASTLGNNLPGEVRLDVFSVGNGACYLVRTGDYTLMFDCGSHEYLDVGERSIVPALGRLGVSRIDALMLSHADIDHFSGTLDVARRLDIKQVCISPQMRDQAEARPEGPVAYVLDRLADLGVPVTVVSRGWRERHDDVNFELLWPAPDWRPKIDNDASLVLRVTDPSGRRIMLNGDVQQAAMTEMFNQQLDLQADVVDLPHHGAFVRASVDWLDAVQPAVVVQSAGPDRLYVDPWAEVFAGRPAMRRYVTATDGMVSVHLGPQGIAAEAFCRQPPAAGPRK